MDILSKLDPIQLVLIELLSGLQKVKPNNNTVVEDSETDLTRVIHKWENLLGACEENNLEDACKLLEQVFPSLINARKKKTGV